MLKLKFLLDVPFLTTLTIFVLLLSLVLEIFDIGSNLFQRSGAIVGAVGAAMIIRNITSVGSETAAKNLCEVDGGCFDDGESYNATLKETKKNTTAVTRGTTLIFVSSIVSGYGDLLMKLLHI